MTWTSYPENGGGDIYATRVTPGGTVLDPNGIRVSTGSAVHPSVAFDGTDYLIVWDTGGAFGGDIYGARVTPAGEVLDPAGIAVSTASNGEAEPKLAFDGTNYLVVWDDSPGSFPTVHGARVARDGTVLDPSGIAISPVTQTWETTPSVASDGTAFMVAWADNQGGATYGTRVSSAGVVLDPGAIPISTGGGSGSIAFDGTNYLVPWIPGQYFQDQGNLYATRVTTGGGVLDPDGLPIERQAPSEQFGPAVWPRRGTTSSPSGRTTGTAPGTSTRRGSRRPASRSTERESRSLWAESSRSSPRSRSTAGTTSSCGRFPVGRAGAPLRLARQPHGDGARPRRLSDLGGERHPA